MWLQAFWRRSAQPIAFNRGRFRCIEPGIRGEFLWASSPLADVQISCAARCGGDRHKSESAKNHMAKCKAASRPCAKPGTSDSQIPTSPEDNLQNRHERSMLEGPMRLNNLVLARGPSVCTSTRSRCRWRRLASPSTMRDPAHGCGRDCGPHTVVRPTLHIGTEQPREHFTDVCETTATGHAVRSALQFCDSPRRPR
jgi:hypothetical protein